MTSNLVADIRSTQGRGQIPAETRSAMCITIHYSLYAFDCAMCGYGSYTYTDSYKQS